MAVVALSSFPADEIHSLICNLQTNELNTTKKVIEAKLQMFGGKRRWRGR